MADNSGRSNDGEAIGICILDLKYPLIPGNAGSAGTYNFPVRIKTIKGLKDNPFPPIRDTSGNYNPEVRKFIKAIKELEEEGVRAIVTSCGFFSLLQKVAVTEVNIPVFTSPLMLIPLISRLIRPDKTIGIITAAAHRLTKEYLEPVGVEDSLPLVIAGMDHSSEFNDVIMEGKRVELNLERLRKDVITVTDDLTKRNPNLGAIVIECSDLPPFAEDIQRVAGVPVFDYIGFTNMIYHAVVQKNYTGMPFYPKDQDKDSSLPVK